MPAVVARRLLPVAVVPCGTMPTYAAQVDVHESQIQNAQDLASLWGDVRTDLEDLGVELEEAYAVLGDFDFLVILEAEDRDQAFQAAVAAERYGMELQTMEITPVEDFGELVADI